MQLQGQSVIRICFTRICFAHARDESTITLPLRTSGARLDQSRMAIESHNVESLLRAKRVSLVWRLTPQSAGALEQSLTPEEREG